MGTVTNSLWLPVGRANFFSPASDPDLVMAAGDGSAACRSMEQSTDKEYIPRLRASVMRRLVEVLPRSFGYSETGSCELSRELGEFSRPISVTMRLSPSAAEDANLDPGAARANSELVRAGVTDVALRVDEHGIYAFAATFTDGGADSGADSGGDGGDDGGSADRLAEVRKALIGHILAVFGGDFTVDRLRGKWSRGFNEGAAAVSRYNGLKEGVVAKSAEHRVSQPLGTLTFFQLNILVEGLCNQALLPSVFFERYDFARRWLAANKGKTSVLTTLAEVIKALVVDVDGAHMVGQVTTMHRFLSVSRGSLQRLKRSVGSVRRQMLDEMMAVLHRQARLIQLDLGATDYESTPELTGEMVTESQMRGYVMLIAVKLPLIISIADAAVVAVDHLKAKVTDDETRAEASADETSAEASDGDLVDSLSRDLHHWLLLLESLRSDVSGLEGAVEHDWQERLLYEQQQSRAEQETLAEIERGRRGRPESRRTGDVAYHAMTLLLSAAGLFYLFRTTTIDALATAPAEELVSKLWPVAVFAVLIFLAAPVLSTLRRLRRDRSANNDSYSFEFTFRLDEPTTPAKVHEYLSRRERHTVTSDAFGRMRVRRLGGWRIERTSPDITLMKVHSVAAVRISPLRYARFEIVTEVLARKIADSNKFFVRQCRMFGDSPKPLELERIRALVREVLTYVCVPLAEDGDIRLEDIMSLTDVICTGASNDVVAPTTIQLPTQREGSHDGPATAGDGRTVDAGAVR